MIKIDIKSGKTKACINATRISCKYTITGPIIGKSKCKTFTVSAESAANNIDNKIQPEVTFQNNLNDNEIIFAKCHTISKIHKNIEIKISKIFTNINNGQSIIFGKFHLSKGI